jgi:raffinose/stachyose/melibiose transport system substrate-binding protein
MHIQRWKKVLLVAAAVFTVSAFAFASGESESTAAEGPVELPFLMRNAGNDSGTLINKFYIENFDKEFEGKYKIVVEWMPGLAEDIRAKLKMLNSAGDLPALVTNLGAEPAFGDLLIANNRLMDLKPYFDSSPEWKDVCIPESIDYNLIDGKMWTSPATYAPYIGMFYNKEHFEKAGISEFPNTWDDFWAACDKLEAAGFTPISLHTTETGWCPMLVATSSMAWKEDGRAFMEQQYPTDYNVPAFVDAMKVLRRLFDYTTPDAVGGNYALASNNFLSGNTSMIPNGPWMIPSLSDTQYAPEGFEEKVGYDQFPDGVMLSWLGLAYGDGVSMDHPLEVREGTVEYIKFLARPENIRRRGVIMGSIAPKVPLTESDLAEMSPAMQEYAKAVTSLQKTLIVYQTRWDPITQNEVIPSELPSFVTDKITVEELVNKMSEAGTKYEKESN